MASYQETPWGRAYCSGPVPTRAPLTREELFELKDRTPIVVLWDGGNGPHRYTLRIHSDGGRYALLNDDEHWSSHAELAGEFSPVGATANVTKVWVDRELAK